MQSIIPSKRSKRFYRNLTLYLLTWIGLFLLLWWLARVSAPFYVYLILAYPLFIAVASVVYAFHRAHPRREQNKRHWSPADIGAAYETVQFPSRDDLMLSGWFVPGARPETIILVHGFSASGMSMIYPASGLLLHGYSVLLFDLRAHGRSAGDTCSLGWREEQDLLGAVDYVRRLYEAANEPKTVWEIPQARHSGGYFVNPELYAEKVAAFFADAFRR